METASKRCGCVLVSSCTLQRCWHHAVRGMPLSPTHRQCPRTVQACPCQWFGTGLSLERRFSSVYVIGCHQGKGGKIELVENAEPDVSSKILSVVWGTQFSAEDRFLFSQETIRLGFSSFRPYCYSFCFVFFTSFSLRNTDFF